MDAYVGTVFDVTGGHDLANIVAVIRGKILLIQRVGVVVMICGFFFQAEDGIRDYKVTGVQTCALPISYILGADVSWLLEDEAAGAFYRDRGVRKDLLEILKSYNFNYIRARIFVNPGAP